MSNETRWFATNRNHWAETIGDPDTLPYFLVMSGAGILLERDDGEIRTFRRHDTAQRAADRLNSEDV